MTGEVNFPEFLSAAQTVAEELTAIREALNRLVKLAEKVSEMP